MPAARIAKLADARLEILRLPSPDKIKVAKEIRRAGGEVPKNMLPTRLGVYRLGAVTSRAAARRLAQAKALEVAAQLACRVRSLSCGQRAWVAQLVPEAS